MEVATHRSFDLTRYRALAYIVACALIGTLVFFGGLLATGRYPIYVPSPVWGLAWFSLVFYLAWWTVYYAFADEPDEHTVDEAAVLADETDAPIVTLRTFLTYNTPRGRLTANSDTLAQKAGDTIKAVGVIVGFSLLVFSFTVNILYEGSPTTLTEDVLTGVLVLQTFAIANFLIAIDSLDTTLNEFKFFDPEVTHKRRKDFYNRGIVSYYRGLIALVLSMFLLTMIVKPVVTIIGVCTFSFYGYHHWFGYETLKS